MEYKYLEDPCRNFCIFAQIKITDPVDGKEKLVLSSFVADGVGQLIFIDPQSGEGETIDLPGDEGAWALYNLDNEKLLVGTCAMYGYLHCLDLKSRTWAAPLRDENERYIWNLDMGSDGMIYGGTWPGCSLLRYDPIRHKLENLGRASEVAGNQYSRYVFGAAPGKVFINCKNEKSHIAYWDMESKAFKAFGKPEAQVLGISSDFICINTDGQLEFYHPETLEQLDAEECAEKLPQRDTRLGDRVYTTFEFDDGTVAGVHGQEYYVLKKGREKPECVKIPALAPATGIMTIASDREGRIWGASSLGQTIFRYNPADGSYWNSLGVCDRGGEVYGLVFDNDRLFMTTYSGGDHVVYDCSGPWDQHGNVNPKTLNPAGPELIRPHSRSILGPDRGVWTGWYAQYGVYGGGLSRIDMDTLEVKVWYDPIPGQCVESIAADDRYIYFITGGSGNGLVYKNEVFYLAVWSTDGEIVRKIPLPQGSTPGQVRVVGNYMLISLGKEIEIYERGTLNKVHTVKLEDGCGCIVAYGEGKAAVFAGAWLYLLDPCTGEADRIGNLPGAVHTAAVTPDGTLYFAHKAGLYRFITHE